MFGFVQVVMVAALLVVMVVGLQRVVQVVMEAVVMATEQPMLTISLPH